MGYQLNPIEKPFDFKMTFVFSVVHRQNHNVDR